MANRKPESVEIVRMANGYMLRTDTRGDYSPKDEYFVFQKFEDAAEKVREMLGPLSDAD